MGVVAILVAVLLAWMAACALCGYHRRYARFLAVVTVGLGLNWGWMFFGLDAHPLDPHALMAQGAAVAYAVGAFGCGWLASRIVRSWRDSRVEDAPTNQAGV